MNAHTQTTTGGISDRALVVSLTISQWSGRRLDRKITDEVNRDHNAAADAGRYNKLLLPKAALDPIQKVVSETRNDFLQRTLPWLNDGSRIMASMAFLDHKQWLSGQRGKFDIAVNDFLADYDKYVLEAQVRLNGMFDPTDYPGKDEIASRFSMNVRVMPVPESEDFRVDMSDDMVQEIKAEITNSVNSAVNEAVSDVYRRVADVTGRMVERLTAYKPAEGKGQKSEGIFRDSLVENVRDLTSIMPMLNITGDPRLTRIADELVDISRFDASVLREDPVVRENVATEAQRILDSISDYL